MDVVLIIVASLLLIDFWSSPVAAGSAGTGGVRINMASHLVGTAKCPAFEDHRND